jgi:D-amino peptidase
VQLLVITDLEGVTRVDSFFQTRTVREERKGPAMDRLAEEVNAFVAGVRSVEPEATIDVWDGHGTGGLRKVDLDDARYHEGDRPYFEAGAYDAMAFVGQHAMAGSPHAPLCHTYSSLAVDYYKLNGTFVGEFACRALLAGRQGVPTVFLSGDDKATLEARQFVPGIETVATKRGSGHESAEHRDPETVLAEIGRGAAAAVDRVNAIPPYTGLEPPYTLEVRFYEPRNVPKVDRVAGWIRKYLPPLGGLVPVSAGVTRIDARTIRVTGDDLLDPESWFHDRL